MINPTYGKPVVAPDDIVARIDALIPRDIAGEPLLCVARTRTPVLIEAAAEIERLRARVAELESALTRTSANLMAAISLLKAGGRDAAPSDKMFRKMLNDYEKAVQDGREKLLEDKP
jgi:hypothetical protein